MQGPTITMVEAFSHPTTPTPALFHNLAMEHSLYEVTRYLLSEGMFILILAGCGFICY